tara:strand:+ start:1123 stop:1482 length:360 start_codon:yes stop_codon:yes gene_type:complete
MQITKKRLKQIINEEMQRLDELDPIGPSYGSPGLSKPMKPAKASPTAAADNPLIALAGMSLPQLDKALDALSVQQKAQLKKLGRMLSMVNTEENFTEFDFSTSPTRIDEAYGYIAQEDK